jgi:predicted cation transporter
VNVLGVGLLFFLFFGVLGVGATILWIWMLIDCATKEPSDGNDKIIWMLVILFTHVIGALIYYFVRRPQRIHLYGA